MISYLLSSSNHNYCTPTATPTATQSSSSSLTSSVFSFDTSCHVLDWDDVISEHNLMTPLTTTQPAIAAATTASTTRTRVTSIHDVFTTTDDDLIDISFPALGWSLPAVSILISRVIHRVVNNGHNGHNDEAMAFLVPQIYSTYYLCTLAVPLLLLLLRYNQQQRTYYSSMDGIQLFKDLGAYSYHSYSSLII